MIRADLSRILVHVVISGITKAIWATLLSQRKPPRSHMPASRRIEAPRPPELPPAALPDPGRKLATPSSQRYGTGAPGYRPEAPGHSVVAHSAVARQHTEAPRSSLGQGMRNCSLRLAHWPTISSN